MGHVWLIICISMVFTFAAAWIWHMDGMNDEERRNKATDDVIIASTEAIAAYRDLLKEKGKEAAVASLPSTTKNYGN